MEVIILFAAGVFLIVFSLDGTQVEISERRIDVWLEVDLVSMILGFVLLCAGAVVAVAS